MGKTISPLDAFEATGAVKRGRRGCTIGQSKNRALYEEAYSVRGWSYISISEFARTLGEDISIGMINRHCAQKQCACHGDK